MIEIRLGDIGEFKGGVTTISTKDYGFGTPFIQYTNIYSNSKVDVNSLMLVNVKPIELERRSCKFGDIFFTASSEVDNEVAMSSVLLDDIDNLTFNGFSKRFRLFNFNTLLPEYARYYFRGIEFRNQVNQRVTGDVRYNISIKSLNDICIRIPSLKEQKAIAEVLSSIDDKIDLLNRQNETLEAMAQTLFRQWFIEESDDSWEEREIGRFAKLIKETVSPATNPDNTFEHYSLPAYDNQKNPTIDQGADIKSNKYKVFNEVILISKLNPGTSRVWLILNEAQDNSICSTEFVVVKPNYKEWLFFIYCLLNSVETSEYLGSCASGTSGSHQRIKPADILNLTFKFGHIVKVKNFSSTVRPFFEKISINITSIKSLVQTRDTLLPKLMSGEVRVKLD
jgi:type I restriction enzyme S subunit